MKIEKLWFYVAGVALGVALATSIALWEGASVAYRVVFIVILGLLLLATWFKRKPRNQEVNKWYMTTKNKY